jgi:hypothetical protein
MGRFLTLAAEKLEVPFAALALGHGWREPEQGEGLQQARLPEGTSVLGIEAD